LAGTGLPENWDHDIAASTKVGGALPWIGKMHCFQYDTRNFITVPISELVQRVLDPGFFPSASSPLRTPTAPLGRLFTAVVARTLSHPPPRRSPLAAECASDCSDGTAAKLGVKRQSPWAGMCRWLDEISDRSLNRAYHYKCRNEPEAADRHRVVTTESVEICSSGGSPENWPFLRARVTSEHFEPYLGGAPIRERVWIGKDRDPTAADYRGLRNGSL
jgi:hypothetical protein